MAFNPSPKVAWAREYARKFSRDMVIVLAIKGDKLEYASFGADKKLCSQAQKLADVAFEALIKRGIE